MGVLSTVFESWGVLGWVQAVCVAMRFAAVAALLGCSARLVILGAECSFPVLRFRRLCVRLEPSVLAPCSIVANHAFLIPSMCQGDWLCRWGGFLHNFSNYPDHGISWLKLFVSMIFSDM